MNFPVAAKLLDACVLGIINDGDTYGYDLYQRIGSTLDVSESALYPVLRRLSKDALLETYDVPFDGRNRKYYKITEIGKSKLKAFREDWTDHKISVEKILLGGSNHE